MPIIDTAEWWEHLKKKVFFPLISREHSLLRYVCAREMYHLIVIIIYQLQWTHCCFRRIAQHRSPLFTEIDCRYNLIAFHSKKKQKRSEIRPIVIELMMADGDGAAGKLLGTIRIANANLIHVQNPDMRPDSEAVSVRYKCIGCSPRRRTWKFNNVIYCIIIIIVLSRISHTHVHEIIIAITFACRMSMNEFIRCTHT